MDLEPPRWIDPEDAGLNGSLVPLEAAADPKKGHGCGILPNLMREGERCPPDRASSPGLPTWKRWKGSKPADSSELHVQRRWPDLLASKPVQPANLAGNLGSKFSGLPVQQTSSMGAKVQLGAQIYLAGWSRPE